MTAPQYSTRSILLCSFTQEEADQISKRFEKDNKVIVAPTADDAICAIRDHDPQSIFVGDRGSRRDLSNIVDSLIQQPLNPDRQLIVFATQTDHSELARAQQNSAIAYAISLPPSIQDIERVIGDLVGDSKAPIPQTKSATTIRSISIQINKTRTIQELADTVLRAAVRITAADQASFFVSDPRTMELWHPNQHPEKVVRFLATTGIIGFVAQTGKAILIERAAGDPRFNPDNDASSIGSTNRVLAVPVSFQPRASLAVIVAVRHPSRPIFSETECLEMEFLANRISARVEELVFETGGPPGSKDEENPRSHQLFRQEAVSHHSEGFLSNGHPLDISPKWLRWSTRVLIGAFFGSFLFCLMASVPEYASGYGFVQVEGRMDVNATEGGIVTELYAQQGDYVSINSNLVRLSDEQVASSLRRAKREYRIALIDRLRRPFDVSTERIISDVRVSLQLAELRMEARLIRAPESGNVDDIRVRVGQQLTVGGRVLSLVTGTEKYRLVCVFPAHNLPLLKNGMALGFKPDGFIAATQRVLVEEVAGEVVGPGEARRIVGVDIADALPLTGPVVFVRATLQSRHFRANGENYDFHDGMIGTAEVTLHSETILATLIPALKALRTDPDA